MDSGSWPSAEAPPATGQGRGNEESRGPSFVFVTSFQFKQITKQTRPVELSQHAASTARSLDRP